MKKFIAILLSFILILGVLPATASGESFAELEFEVWFIDVAAESFIDKLIPGIELRIVPHITATTAGIVPHFNFFAALYDNNGRLVQHDFLLTGFNVFWGEGDTFMHPLEPLGIPATDLTGWEVRVFIWADGTNRPLMSRVVTLDSHDPLIPRGEGTEESPFLLSRPEHLEWINGDVERLEAHYLVVNDIVAPKNFMVCTLLHGYEYSWIPPFSGIFDGGGHMITVNVNTSRTTIVDGRTMFSSGGLFRFLSREAEVRNLKIGGVMRGTGRWTFGIGGLAAYNYGLIENVVVAADVVFYDSSFGRTGGIAAFNAEGGLIRNAYSTGNITGIERVGGIVGFNFGTVSTSYSVGIITGNDFVGGIAGQNLGTLDRNIALSTIVTGENVGRIWGAPYGDRSPSSPEYPHPRNFVRDDMLLNGATIDPLQVPYEMNGFSLDLSMLDSTIPQVVEMVRVQLEELIEWDFDEVWMWNDDTNLPTLRNIRGEQNHMLQFAVSNIPVGAGTEAAPFLLSTPEHLTWINGDIERLSKHFVLMNDIVAPNNLMIGSDWSTAFAGTFDGGGHTITMNNNYPSFFGMGLFGAINENGVVRNLIVGGNISGHGTVGGLVARNQGTIDNVSVVATVFGRVHIGGIVGINAGTITNSNFSGTVTGASAGGITGSNTGSISNSHSSGSIYRNTAVNPGSASELGGIAGRNSGTITRSFSTANVSGNSWIGGIAGNNSGIVSNTYSTGIITGRERVGGIVGWNFGNAQQQAIVQNSYAIGVIQGIGEVAFDNPAGGIVGSHMSNGMLSNSVALNPSVTHHTGYASRMMNRSEWDNETSLSSNNRARADMRVNGGLITTGTLTNQDGLSVTLDSIHTQAFWQTTMDWDFDEVWMWNDDTNLPTLRNIRGEQNHMLQ